MTHFRLLRTLFSAVRKPAAAFVITTAIAATAAGQTNTFPASGNAGVGTTTPDQYANVHVYNPPNAGIDIQSSSTAGWARLRLRTGTRTYGWFAGDASAGDAPNKIGLFDYTAGVFRMMIDTSGHVGIGTNNPSSRLSITGQADNLLAVTSTGSGANDTVANFSNPGGSLMIVRANGNVGIGTMAPSQKLDVAGEIRSSSGGFRFPDGSLQTTAATGGGGGSQWVGSSSIYYNGGNVGIGSANPGARLDIGVGSAARGSYSDLLIGTGGNNAQMEFYGPTKSSAITHDEGNGGLIFYTNGPSFSPSMFITNGGNVGIGTTTPANKLHVAGSITIDGNINAKYQDVAEWVPAAEQLATATVVVLDPTKSNHVISSTEAYDTRVAGVISAQPGITLGEAGAGKVLVATTGRVRVKVDASRAPIQIGDLLVTSDMPGVAMKSEPVKLGGRKMHMPGTIIGKALEPLPKGQGEISVLLSLQ